MRFTGRIRLFIISAGCFSAALLLCSCGGSPEEMVHGTQATVPIITTETTTAKTTTSEATTTPPVTTTAETLSEAELLDRIYDPIAEEIMERLVACSYDEESMNNLAWYFGCGDMPEIFAAVAAAGISLAEVTGSRYVELDGYGLYSKAYDVRLEVGAGNEIFPKGESEWELSLSYETWSVVQGFTPKEKPREAILWKTEDALLRQCFQLVCWFRDLTTLEELRARFDEIDHDNVRRIDTDCYNLIYFSAALDYAGECRSDVFIEAMDYTLGIKIENVAEFPGRLYNADTDMMLIPGRGAPFAAATLESRAVEGNRHTLELMFYADTGLLLPAKLFRFVLSEEDGRYAFEDIEVLQDYDRSIGYG